MVKHGSTLLNVGLFLVLAVLLVGDTASKWRHGRFDFVEATLALQSTVGLGVILLRSPAKAVSTDVRHQLVAIICFCSAAWFMKDPITESAALLASAKGTALLANVVGLISIVNLGKSFGILVALRKVKTNGLYGIVRHPMYLTDILARVGMVLQVPTAANVALGIITSALYVQRARFEEEFLAQDPAYRDYMQRVRYRFIPGIY
jgi:protein-S-isoprenylcysteine O-methyltransferase Ste14